MVNVAVWPYPLAALDPLIECSGAYSVAINATATQDYIGLNQLPACTGVAETPGVPKGETSVSVTEFAATAMSGLILPTVFTTDQTNGGAGNGPAVTAPPAGTTSAGGSSQTTGSAGSGQKSGAPEASVGRTWMLAVICAMMGIGFAQLL